MMRFRRATALMADSSLASYARPSVKVRRVRVNICFPHVFLSEFAEFEIEDKLQSHASNTHMHRCRINTSSQACFTTQRLSCLSESEAFATAHQHSSTITSTISCTHIIQEYLPDLIQLMYFWTFAA